MAIRRNVDVIALTDHGTIEGALEAQKIWKKVKVIVGEEILTSDGEVVGYFLQEAIPNLLPASETIRRIHDQGGLVSVDHPFCRLRRHPLSRAALDRHAQDIDFIEVFNARNVFNADNKIAEEYSLSHKITACVGSDAHTRWEIGNAVAEVSDFNDAKSFKNVMNEAAFTTRRSPIAVHVATKYTKWYKAFARDRQTHD